VNGSASTDIVMVSATKIDSVNIHASIVGPVVCKSDNELDTSFARSIDNFVKSLDVNSRLAVGPALEDDFGASGALPAVLWETFRNVCDVLVVETPCSENVQAGLFRCSQAQLNIGLVLCGMLIAIWVQSMLQLTLLNGKYFHAGQPKVLIQ
jgi:hypothetical protein